MDMKEEVQAAVQQMTERLNAAMEMLERFIAAQGQMALSAQAGAEESIGRIVATVENGVSMREAENGVTIREAELAERLAVAERTIAELRASATTPVTNPNRRTMAAGLMAKQEGGIEAGSAFGALDAALVSLSLEQRIAVKAQLLRAGIV